MESAQQTIRPSRTLRFSLRKPSLSVLLNLHSSFQLTLISLISILTYHKETPFHLPHPVVTVLWWIVALAGLGSCTNSARSCRMPSPVHVSYILPAPSPSYFSLNITCRHLYIGRPPFVVLFLLLLFVVARSYTFVLN